MDIQISELVNSTAQLEPKAFEAFIQAVYQQRAKQRSPSLSIEEEELLNKIYTKLPKAIQKRFEQLNSKFSTKTISAEEYNEYLGLIELKENHNAECVANIVKLAQIKGIQPKELMQQLGIFPLNVQ